MTVEFRPGVFGELQIHIPEMMEAKSRVGHVIYEHIRLVEKGTTDETRKRLATYNADSVRLYASANFANQTA